VEERAGLRVLANPSGGPYNSDNWLLRQQLGEQAAAKRINATADMRPADAQGYRAAMDFGYGFAG
jgi:hypothetical protein